MSDEWHQRCAAQLWRVCGATVAQLRRDMADDNTIIEGTVKFRDGKKVSIVIQHIANSWVRTPVPIS